MASLLLLMALVLPATSVGGAVVDLDGDLRVEWHPDRLELEPGEQGTALMRVENLGSERLIVELTFTAVKTSGGCRATVLPDFFELSPGASQDVRVEVRSNADLGQDPGVSDCRIVVKWGRNLTRDEKGNTDAGTVEGSGALVIPVDDDFSTLIITVVEVVVVLVVLVVAVAYLILRRRGSRPARPTGPDEPSADLGPFR